MRHLVIGIPARNEAATIGPLSIALDVAASLLGEIATVEQVLAYQDSTDDTLGSFVAASGRGPRRVLRSPVGTLGKGRNVALLVEHAIAVGADLLLVDGDLRDPVAGNFARFVAAGYDNGWDMVLPLWCRPWGHANTTNYLTVPAVRALFGAEVRQPLAGQRLLAHGCLARLDTRHLPNDYGIDIALTMAVLEAGGHLGQVIVPRIEHDDRQLNSDTIMVEVARALLERVSGGPTKDRSDVTVPVGYARRLGWPDGPVQPARPGRATAARNPRRAWLEALASAVRGAADGLDPHELAKGLIHPFFDHADWRRRAPRPEVDEAEGYVWELATDLTALLA